MRPGLRGVVFVLASLLAGCVGQPGAIDDAVRLESARTEDPPAPFAPVRSKAPSSTFEVNVSWKGWVGKMACVPGGPNWCENVMPFALSNWDAYREFPFDRNVTRGHFVVTWTPETPTTETLALELYHVAPCGEGVKCGHPLKSIEGRSPVELEISDVPIYEGQSIAMFVRPTFESVGPAFFGVTLDQHFDVEGVIELAWNGGYAT